MKTCSTHGQAVGTAAAYCIKNNILPVDLANENKAKDAVWSIQQQLIRDDAYVIGIYNQDPRDHARNASNITASSVYVNTSMNWYGYAANVVSGQTRAVDGKAGVYNGSNAYISGINRWMSKDISGKNLKVNPEWIKLEWNYDIKGLSSIELIHDTGMHRKLTLTQKDIDPQKMIWGRPQPETTKDYTIEVRNVVNNKWIMLVDINDNYQRRVIHNVTDKANGIIINALRVNITATNGDDYARICGIRVYDNMENGDLPFPQKV